MRAAFVAHRSLPLQALIPFTTRSSAQHCKLPSHCRLLCGPAIALPLSFQPSVRPSPFRIDLIVSRLSLRVFASATMSTKAPPSDLPSYSFTSAAQFEAFLEKEHATAAGFYLKFAKKSSGIPSISAAEAVEVALCFGWIDGRANAVDDKWWTVRYTPRRAKSIWSQKNVNTVGRLMEQGQMRPAGLVAIEAAKADGRWERAYAGPATITVPDDLTTALAADPTAAAFFEGMNKSDRYSVLWRVETASLQSRAKRIEALVQTLAAGKRPGAPADRVVKVIKKTTEVKKTGPPRRKLDSLPPVHDDQVRQSRREGLRKRS